MRCAGILLLLLLLPLGARAEGRFALLIGNQTYSEKVGRLRNPHNDIALVGAALEKIGFKVTNIKDADYRAIDTALKRHIQEVRRAGEDTISFVYYSGHGASDPDTEINYLIPIDVEGADEASVWTNSIELGDVVNKLRDQSPLATHYVVFDACREELHLTRDGKKAIGAERGFVAIANVTGVMIAYATAPGRTASDLGQGSGPYAKALAEEIVKPGVEAVTMFRNVQLKVREAIGQDPWLSFPTLPAVYFAGKRTTPEGPRPEHQLEIAFWESVKDKKDPAVLATYLERYPKGEFASTARALVDKYEQQLRSERAVREAEKTRLQEAARKAAEAQRLEEEGRAREAALVEERRRAEELKHLNEAKQQEDKQRAEAAARAEELRKALEEARIAQEAAKTAEEQRLAALRAAEEAKSRAKLASLPPAGDGKVSSEILSDDPVALARALQTELKRVGCYTGEADGTWGTQAQSALEQFVRSSKADIPAGLPSKAALQAVSGVQDRICPQKSRPKPRAAARPRFNDTETSYEPSGRGPGKRGWVGRVIRAGRGN